MSVITYTVNGIVGALPPSFYSYYYTGIDYSGVFGPAGASIVGDHFWATWTGIPCECIGVNNPNSPLHLYNGYPYPSPIIDVTLQIGNQPYGHNPVYDFGNGGLYGYGEFRTGGDLGGPNTWLQLNDGSNVMSNGGNGSLSGFRIGGTSGLLTYTAMGIPAPELGTGWTSLLIVALMWVCYRHRCAMR